MLVYFMCIWNCLRQFGIFCGHFVYFASIWYAYFTTFGYIFAHFGMLFQEKSGSRGVSPICLRPVLIAFLAHTLLEKNIRGFHALSCLTDRFCSIKRKILKEGLRRSLFPTKQVGGLISASPAEI
jgi:hypothetical protein